MEKEDPDKFRQFVLQRKNFNWSQTFKQKKMKDKDEQVLRQQKTQERMKKEVVKGKPLQRRYLVNSKLEAMREETRNDVQEDNAIYEFEENN